ncbi:MAG: hypothetical protein ACRDJW_18890 [Thermomicrobiales bacterium]
MMTPIDAPQQTRQVAIQYRDQRLSRRRLVGSSIAATGLVVVASVERRAGSAPASDTPAATEALDVITTDAALREYAGRSVRDLMRVRRDRPDEWQTAELAGEKPEHRFDLRARVLGNTAAIESTFLLHGEPARVLHLTVNDDLADHRLWLSKDYLHLDLGRTLFPQHNVPEAYTDQLWFATFPVGSLTPEVAAQPSYTYHRESGFLGLPLTADFRYEFRWQTYPDGISRDYHTVWYRDNDVVAELSESVFPSRGDGLILPLPISVYLETSAMACCTAKANEWACC